ncbi:MAG TPA: hypothetical protein PLU81_12725 [Deltaproteobacteria bacterium]|nr:hypothetical protein [Deltaproteobacteria bacterium]
MKIVSSVFLYNVLIFLTLLKNYRGVNKEWSHGRTCVVPGDLSGIAEGEAGSLKPDVSGVVEDEA